jgi:hypothetical protein
LAIVDIAQREIRARLDATRAAKTLSLEPSESLPFLKHPS